MSKDKQKKDAWRKLYDLQDKYIRTWNFRKGAPYPMGPIDTLTAERRAEMDKNKLIVTANPLERHIMLNERKSNVSTVREYIEVLKLACDWVDECNPEWATHPVELDPPEKFEYIR